jgi:transcription termination/antitermination protein NusG
MREITITSSTGGQRENLPWYVVRVRPNSEWKTTASLTGRGYEVFLPLLRRPTARSRAKLLEVPLFPGYVFCRFDRRNLVPIVSATGVVQVLSRDHRPEAVDDDEIVALRSIALADLPLEPWPTFETGQKIKILYGPLAGIEGRIVRDGARPQLVVSVSLLHRSVVAHIDREYIDPLPYLKCALDVVPPCKVPGN